MTQQGKMQAFRELSPDEVALVAGGQTAEETEITQIYTNSYIVVVGNMYAISNDGIMFVDQDENGWYDRAEFSAGGLNYTYDWTCDCWVQSGSPIVEQGIMPKVR